MFTHYVGNDIYAVNLLVGDSIDPIDPKPVSLEVTRKVLGCTHSVKEFMDNLREATSHIVSF